MGFILVRLELNSVSGLDEDKAVNDFHFRWDGPVGPTTANLTSLNGFVQGFYNTVHSGQVNRLAGYISHEISRGAAAHRSKIYRKDDVSQPWGSPVLQDTWTLGAGLASGISLPGEVAVVLTERASLTGIQEELGNTRPASRRRGRLYLGPLNSAALSLGAGVSGVQRPAATFLTDLRIAASATADLANDIMSLEAGLWYSVWSQVDNVMRNVVDVQTDDAFDTQRRRGAGATGRVTLAVPQT